MRLIFVSLLAFPGLAATSIVHSDFDSGPAGWVEMGESGSVRVARDAADLREGKPSLAFDYEIGQRKFAAAVLSLDPAAMADMDQIHFWVKTDFPTSVIVILNEKGGGNYTAPAWSPGSIWQEVRLEPRDFALGEQPNDPPDPDGKLDINQVQGVGVTDLAQIFGAVPRHPSMPIAMADRSGKHTLLISGFEVLGGNPARKDNLVIDEFDAPQFSWISPGGAAFHFDKSGDHAPGPAMEVHYTQAASAIVYIGRNLPPNMPPNITHISFDIASDKPALFVFTLQEKGSGHGEGPRYTTVVEVKGKGKSDHRDLALRAFNLGQNSPPDPDGALNIAKVKSIAIAEVSRTLNADSGPNRFWISNLRLVAE